MLLQCVRMQQILCYSHGLLCIRVYMYPYVTRMYSCCVLVAIVAYKTCHWPLVFVITLENPSGETEHENRQKAWIYYQHMDGAPIKEEEAKRNTQFIDIERWCVQCAYGRLTVFVTFIIHRSNIPMNTLQI